jgi:hypothetical protein
MTHGELVARAYRWLAGTMRCGVILRERTLMSGGEQADLIGWTARRGSIVVECKISRSDFLRDRHKPHRRVPDLAMGRLRYYFTGPGVAFVEDLPAGFGFAEVRDLNSRVRVYRHAEPQAFNEARERALLINEARRWQRYNCNRPCCLASGQTAAATERS